VVRENRDYGSAVRARFQSISAENGRQPRASVMESKDLPRRRSGQSFSHAPLAHISHLTESNISYRAQHDISQKETIHYCIVSFYFI
jgi:hypothetical protein